MSSNCVRIKNTLPRNTSILGCNDYCGEALTQKKEEIKSVNIKFFIPFFKVTIFSLIICLCISGCKRDNDNRNYLDNDLSIRLEQNNIQNFFNRHGFDLTVTHTENVSPYRIFLHDLTASEDKIKQIITVLELDSVTQKDYEEIHTGKFVNPDFKIHSPIGIDYLKNPEILFYKGEINNKTAQKELSASKTYLYYNKKTKKACFQIYHGWG